MFDGNRPGGYRSVRHGIGDRVAASLISILSLEGIINMLVALAIFLALLNYIVIPQYRRLADNVHGPPAGIALQPPGEVSGDKAAD
ncbi:MAG: hypothetical protein R3F46_06185 [bacterium]